MRQICSCPMYNICETHKLRNLEIIKNRGRKNVTNYSQQTLLFLCHIFSYQSSTTYGCNFFQLNLNKYKINLYSPSYPLIHVFPLIRVNLYTIKSLFYSTTQYSQLYSTQQTNFTFTLHTNILTYKHTLFYNLFKNK